ncbi:MAG: hypothetical protein JNM84_24510 [Planctomycetes bacterium]|nr:hypothetical protein [Planctomycetota bacterium]
MFQAGELIQMGLPSSLGGSFRNSVAGHFTRLHCNDAVVLVGQNALMVHAPAIHRSAYALPMPGTLPAGFDPNDVNDIVTVPHGRIAGHDALALVTGGGLWLWTYEVNASNEWSPQVVKLGGSVWNGAQKLRCADVDGDGNWDILGLMSNGSSIRCYRRGSPTPAGWVMHLGGPVRDFAVFDFVSGGTPEIVALTGEVERREGQNTYYVPPGLRAYSTTGGSLLFEQSLANDRGVVLPWMRTFGEPPTSEARVIVATTAGTTHAVQSFTSTGSAFVGHGSYALADEATALAVGKFFGAANDSLVVTLRGFGQPIRITTDATGALLETFTISTGPADLPAGVENFAQPLLVDFHGAPYAAAAEKHSPKLLYPSQVEGLLKYQRQMYFEYPFVKLMAGLPQGQLSIDPTSIPSGATHVEIIAWYYDVENRAAEATTDVNAWNRIALTGAGQTIGPISLPGGETYTWYLAVRFLELGSAGNTLRRWPAGLMLYGSQESGILDIVEMLEESMTPYAQPAGWFAYMSNAPSNPIGVAGVGTHTPPPPPPPGGGTPPPPPPPAPPEG